MTFQCIKCGVVKDTTEFFKSTITKRGHAGACKVCVGIRNKQWRQDHPDLMRSYTKKWRQNNPGRDLEVNRKSRVKHAARVKATRRKQVLKQYGLTPDDFAKLKESQNNLCAICKTSTPGGRYNQLHVDHDHISGIVRGLLCNDCNIGIGHFKDNRDLLLTAANYLNVEA